jgi:hypothetical protein
MTNMETPQRDKQLYDQHGDPTSSSMTNMETPQRDKQLYDQHGDPTKRQADI